MLCLLSQLLWQQSRQTPIGEGLCTAGRLGQGEEALNIGPSTPLLGSLNLTEDGTGRIPKCTEAAGILSFQKGPQSYTISDLLPVPRLGHRSVTEVCPSLPSVTLQEAGALRACSPYGCGLRSSYIPPWERKLLSFI